MKIRSKLIKPEWTFNLGHENNSIINKEQNKQRVDHSIDKYKLNLNGF